MGQINLVPNPSFEEYDTCPNGLSNIDDASFWFQPNNYWGSVTNSGSSDFFNSCSVFAELSTPNNIAGYQLPKTGQGYSAIATFSFQEFNKYREYIEVKLATSLIANKSYCISLYISLANDFNFGATGIGAYLSMDSVLDNSIDLDAIIVQPQIHSSLTEPIMDTVNWVEVSGEFIAQGGEQFLTIGNFFEGNSIVFQQFNNFPSRPFAYYLIDDVSVYACDTGIWINESNVSISKLYTSQNGEWVFENSSNKGMILEVFNSLGQQVFKQTIQKGKQVFYPNLQKGIYYWQANEQREKMVVE